MEYAINQGDNLFLLAIFGIIAGAVVIWAYVNSSDEE